MVLSVQSKAQEIICHNVYLSRQHVLRLLRNLVRRPFDKLLAVCSRQRDLKRTSGSMLPGCLLLWVCAFSFVVIGCYYHCHYDHYQHLTFVMIIVFISVIITTTPILYFFWSW